MNKCPENCVRTFARVYISHTTNAARDCLSQKKGGRKSFWKLSVATSADVCVLTCSPSRNFQENVPTSVHLWKQLFFFSFKFFVEIWIMKNILGWKSICIYIFILFFLFIKWTNEFNNRENYKFLAAPLPESVPKQVCDLKVQAPWSSLLPLTGQELMRGGS